MDNADNKRIATTLAQIKRNENVTFNLMHKQMTIMSSTMQKMLEPIRNLEDENERTQQLVAAIIKHMDVVSKTNYNQTEVLRMRTAINTFLETITMELEEFTIIQQKEIQTMDAIIARKFQHNMIDVEAFRMSYKKMVA